MPGCGAVCCTTLSRFAPPCDAAARSPQCPGWRRRWRWRWRWQYSSSSGDGDSKQRASAQPSARQHRPQHQMLHLHSGPGGSGGDRTRLTSILVRTSSSAAQPSPRRTHHRIAVRQQLGGAHAATAGATHRESRCLVQPAASSHHMTEPFRPFTSSASTATAACGTPYPARASLPACTAVATRLLLAAAEPLSCAHPRPVAGFRFSSAHTPTPACTRLATLVPLTPTRPPSRCTTRCDAWLTRVADSSSLPADWLACFDCETLLPPLLRFRACEFPRHHHPIPVSRDFTFTSGYLCFTLRRFASQHPHLHARH